jgi:formamidopyrimidine-DNA glycosylase
LKTTLTDQTVLAGIGNCYADEICHAAGLRPDRTLSSLSDQEMASLYDGLRSVLAEAVSVGGYMEVPLYAGDRLTGGYNARCRVYDREGEPCPRCGSAIIRLELASRKTFLCPGCQR